MNKRIIKAFRQFVVVLLVLSFVGTTPIAVLAENLVAGGSANAESRGAGLGDAGVFVAENVGEKAMPVNGKARAASSLGASGRSTSGAVALSSAQTFSSDAVYYGAGVSEDPQLDGGGEVQAEAAEEQVTVTFKNWDGTILRTYVVDKGTEIAPLALDAAPLAVREGYTFKNWYTNTEFIYATEDIVYIAAFETVMTYVLQIEYRYNDGTLAHEPHVATLASGMTYSVDSPEIEGYAPNLPNVSGIATGSNDQLTYVVTYNPNGFTPYTVAYFMEALDGSYEQYGPTEQFNAEAGSWVTVATPSHEGFTLRDPDTLEHKVAADGSTEIEIYYDRNSYTILFDTTGGSFVDPIILKYQASITWPADPTWLGYTFTGWLDGETPLLVPPAVMPAYDMAFSATWAAEEASYTVLHWKQSVEGGNNYDMVDSDTATAPVGSQVVIDNDVVRNGDPDGADFNDPDSYCYFDFDASKTAAGLVDITIANDGSTVVNYYYTRATMEMTVRVYNTQNARWEILWTKSGLFNSKIADGTGSPGNWPTKELAEQAYYDTYGGPRTVPFVESYDPDTGDPIYGERARKFQGWAYIASVPPNSGAAFLSWIEAFRFSWLNGSGETAPATRLGKRKLELWATFIDVGYSSTVEQFTELKPGETSSNYVNGHYYVESPVYAATLVTNGLISFYPSDKFKGFHYNYYKNWYDHSTLRDGSDIRFYEGLIANWVSSGPSGTVADNMPYNHLVYVYQNRLRYNIRFYNMSGLDGNNAPTWTVEKLQPIWFDMPINVVGYDANRANYDGSSTFFVPSRPAFLNEGYTFGGWYKTGECTPGTEVDWSIDMPATDIAVFAKWIPPVFDVTFDTAFDDVPDPATQTVPMNEKATQPAMPVKEGYTFLYWYRDNPAVPFLFASQAITQDTHLTARWRPMTNISYTVYYKDFETQADLAPSRVVRNKEIDSTVTEMAKAIPEHIPDYTSKSLLLKTINNNVITFWYRPFTEMPYKVRYLDAEDLHELLAEKGAQGLSITVTENAPSIPGYAVDQGTKTLVLSLDEDQNVITFYYHKNNPASYTVKYHLQNANGVGYTLQTADTQVRQTAIGKKVTLAEVLKTYTDYELNSGLSTQYIYVAKDGSSVIDVYYDRVAYDYVIHYYEYITAGVNKGPTTNRLSPDDTLSAPWGQSVTAGYKVIEEFSPHSAVPTDRTIVIQKFTGPNPNVIILYYAKTEAPSAKYDVQHWIEGLDGEYTLAETESDLTGYVDQDALYTPKTKDDSGYAIYTYDPEQTTSDPEGFKVSDETKLVIKLYYTLDDSTFIVRHHRQDPNGTYPEALVESEAPVTAKIGSVASYTIKDGATDPNYLNYTFDHVDPQGPHYVQSGGTLVIDLYYALDGSAYTIEHYLEDATGSFPQTPNETEDGSAKIGSVITPTPKDYPNYTYDESLTEPKLAIVQENGGLVIKLYYRRVDATFIVNHHRQGPDGQDNMPVVTETLSGKAGLPAQFTPKGKLDEGFEVYTYQESKTQSTPAGFIVLADGTLVLDLYYTLNQATVVINHHREHPDGGYPAELTETIEYLGTVGDTVQVVPKRPSDEGYRTYTYNPDLTETSEPNFRVTENGIVIDLYYELQNAPYVVEHYLQNAAGTFPSTPTNFDTGSGKIGSVVIPTPRNYPNYSYDALLTTPSPAIVLENGSLVIKLYYVRVDATFTVNHFRQNTDGTYPAAPSDTESVGGKAGENAVFTPKTPSTPGYENVVYNEAKTEPQALEERIVKEDGSLVINLYYDLAVVSFIVNHHRQGLDGQYSMPVVTETLSGKATQQAVFTPKTKLDNGFQIYTHQPSENKSTPDGFIIMVDGSLVIDLYYTLDKATVIINHHREDPTGNYPSDLTETDEYQGSVGETVQVVPKQSTDEGYENYTHNPDLTETSEPNFRITEDGIVIDLYYELKSSVYVVRHHRMDEFGNYPETLVETEQPKSGKIGAPAVYVKKTTSDAGYENHTYSYTAPSGNLTILPNDALTIDVYYTLNGANYQVWHIKQNPDGSYPTTASDIDTRGGKIGSLAGYDPKTESDTGYEYYRYVPGMTQSVPAGFRIDADGALVIKLYYALNEVEFVVRHHRQWIDNSYPDSLMVTDSARLGRIGDTVAYDALAKPKTVAGFQSHTYNRTLSTSTPAGFIITPDGRLIIDLYYELDMNDVITYHHRGDENGEYPGGMVDEETGTGKIGETVVPNPKDSTDPGYENYTYDPDSTTTNTGDFVIPEEGPLVIDLYYVRKDANYVVIHHRQSLTGEYPDSLAVSEQKSGKIGLSITPVPKTKGDAGFKSYTYQPTMSMSTPAGFKIVAGDALVIHLYYTLDEGSYTIIHHREDPNGNYPESLVDRENGTGLVGEEVIIRPRDDWDPNYENYVYNPDKTTPLNPGDRLIPDEGGLVIDVYYDLKESTYVVRHHRMDTDGTYRDDPSLIDVEGPLTGKIGAEAQYTVKTGADPGYENYSFDRKEPTGNVVILPGGVLVIDLYYVLGGANYKVEHHLQNVDGTYSLNETQNRSGKIGANASFSGKTKSDAGYENYTFQPTLTACLPAGANFKIQPEDALVVKLFYTLDISSYEIRHHRQDTDGSYPSDMIDVVDGLTGKIGDVVVIIPKTKADEGYQHHTYDGNPQTNSPGFVILPGGRLVIDLYYTLDEAPYTINHHRQAVDGSYPASLNVPEGPFPGRIGAEAAYGSKPKTDPDFANYTYQPSMTSSTPAGFKITADGSLVIDLYYALDTSTYTVRHHRQGEDGSYPADLVVTEPEKTGLIGDVATYTVKTSTDSGFAGYSFSNRTPETDPLLILAANELVVDLYYTRNQVIVPVPTPAPSPTPFPSATPEPEPETTRRPTTPVTPPVRPVTVGGAEYTEMPEGDVPLAGIGSRNLGDCPR